jgi:hypothetical protein
MLTTIHSFCTTGSVPLTMDTAVLRPQIVRTSSSSPAVCPVSTNPECLLLVNVVVWFSPPTFLRTETEATSLCGPTTPYRHGPLVQLLLNISGNARWREVWNGGGVPLLRQRAAGTVALGGGSYLSTLVSLNDFHCNNCCTLISHATVTVPTASLYNEPTHVEYSHTHKEPDKTNKLHGLSPRASYTDRATAACRRSDCQLLRIEGATWSAWRIPTAVFSVF